MKYFTILLFVFGFVSDTRAQSVLYSGPEVLLPNSTENYARVEVPNGVTVIWSISGNGGTIEGGKTNPLVFFKVTTSPIVLTANLSNATSISDTIPIVQQGPTLQNGNIAMVAGIRQHRINQILRGERFKVKPVNFTGANPTLTLLSSQGRVIARGDSIDFRAPTRGLFFVVVDAPAAGQLKVEGIPTITTPGGGIGTTTPLIQPECTVGNLEYQLANDQHLTGGESMVTLGNQIITAVYDFELRKTHIRAYQNDQLTWTWSSNENEYIRTLNVHPTFGIAGIGSSGGALNRDDQVLVVRITSNGVLQAKTSFGTADGTDYGYGVSFLGDGSIMATGFTEGSFSGFSNAGALDAFAVHIGSTGAILQMLQYGTPANDRVFASQTLTNGNVLLFGDTEGQIGDTGNPQGAFDIFFTELTPTCTQVKNTQLGTDENDLAFDLVVDPASGDFFITGMTTGEFAPGFGNPPRPQVYTARIDHQNHTIAWMKQLGPKEGQSGESLALSSTGVGVIFYTFGSFSGANNNSLGTPASDDMVVALFDFDGQLDALFQFDQTIERIFARAITFRGNNIFVLRDHVYEPGKPYITTSLDRFTNPIEATGSDDPTAWKETIQVAPNPASTELNISFPETSNYAIEIININGSIVLKSQNQNRVDIARLENGIYFLRIYTSKSSCTKKIVIKR